MLLNETLTILKAVLEKIETKVEVVDALDPIHVEIDEETLEPKEDEEFPDEFDLVLGKNLSHDEIKAIGDILANYPNVEMRLRNGKVEIFETFKEA